MRPEQEYRSASRDFTRDLTATAPAGFAGNSPLGEHLSVPSNLQRRHGAILTTTVGLFQAGCFFGNAEAKINVSPLFVRRFRAEWKTFCGMSAEAGSSFD